MRMMYAVQAALIPKRLCHLVKFTAYRIAELCPEKSRECQCGAIELKLQKIHNCGICILLNCTYLATFGCNA